MGERFSRDSNSWEGRLVAEVLRQIDEGGIDSVRVSRIADRTEVAIGTLYNRVGPRERILEYAWRRLIAALERIVEQSLVNVSPQDHMLEWIVRGVLSVLPEHMDSFWELHSARRRWHRVDVDPDGCVVRSLIAYVELCQRYGHFRPGPSRLIAGVFWWVLMGAYGRGGNHDAIRLGWCLDVLKRALLMPDAAELALDLLDITVVEPTPNHH